MRIIKIYIDCFLAVLFLLTLGSNSPAQKKVSKEFTSARNDDSHLYLKLDSAKYYITIDPQKSFEFTESALTGSIESHNRFTEAISYQVLGQINDEIKQYDIAQNYYIKAIQAFKENNNKQYLNDTYIQYATSLIKSNENVRAIDYLNKALEYYESAGNKNKISEIKQIMANAYKNEGNKDKALNYLDDALTYEKEAENIEKVVELQQKKGDIYLEGSNDEQAILNYNQSVQSARASKNNQLLTNSLKSQSVAFRKNKMYKEELEAREELVSLNLQEKNIPEMAANKIEIADIYLEMNEEEKAEPYILESIKLSEKTGDIKSKGNAFKKLSTVYDRKKEYDKALDAYKEYVATVDKIHARQKEEIQASVQLYTNINRKLQRLDMLEQDLELNRKSMKLLMHEQELNKKELLVQKRVSYTLLFILFGLTLATFLMYRSSMNKRKANQLLALKSLRSQMNPHFIYNSLNSINNFIARNDERSANKYLSSFSRLMRSVMDNSKDDFVTLTSELDILKLYLELENSRFPDKFDYKIEIDENIDPDHYMVPPMLIQPFLENSIWHGLRYKPEKGFLRLQMTNTDHCLKIVIEDNGIGRKKSVALKTKYQKEHKSSGLKNIENRLQIIRNVFHTDIKVHFEDMDNNDRTGTKVTIVIPEKASVNNK